ncbi:MAG: hypothetical protein LQ345_004484 [Seirophora villosa]|nr:MAG: hypothetical protein LQ345_004484 [Seirophora villosa]
MSGQLADITIARLLNLRTGRDDDAWWQPIVLQNRRIRAEKEAKAIRERFGDVRLIDRLTKEHLAHLINNEIMDVLHFESHAAPTDNCGNRPSVRTLQAMRKAKTDEAILDAMAERWRRAHMHLIPAATHDEPDAEHLPSITRQKFAVNQTITIDPQSSTGREGVMLDPAAAHEDVQTTQASNGMMTRDTASILQESRRASSVTLGEEDIGSDAATARVADVARSSEVNHVLEELGTFPTRTVGISGSERPLTTTVFLPSRSPTSRSSRDSLSEARQSDIVPTGPHGQGLCSSQGNTQTTPKVPPIVQGGLNPSQVVHSAQTVTPDDTSFQSRPLQPGIHTGISHREKRALKASTCLHGPALVDQSVNAWQQGLEPLSPVPNATVFPSGWNRMKWAYRTHTVADLELQKHGIWLYERPPTCQVQKGDHRNIIPPIQHYDRVIVAPHSQSENSPDFMSDGQTLVLFPHSTPWHPDQRSADNTHAITPDHIFATRLTEYQALEAIGYEVWRHDRKYLPCTNPACQKVLSDQVRSTLICLGCGPKTTIRYCSRACQTSDSYRHGQDCGRSLHLIQSIIDPGTAPPRFSHLFPAVRLRHGIQTFETYRQRLYAQNTANRYTLFDPRTGCPTTLVWDYRFGDDGGEVPYRGYGAEMEARVERCLNIALLDQSQAMVLEYLFRLLQRCLRLKQHATPPIVRALQDQFALEFGFHANASWRVAAGDEVCECEWSGDDVPVRKHAASCRQRCRGVGEVCRGRRRCLRGLVEGLEARYWILRAWRKGHPTERDWRRRVLGHGFPGCAVAAGWVPRFGPGWEGLWAAEDDVCG